MTKRRGNGDGSYRQRKNGSWQASLMIGYTADGKKDIRYFSGPTRAAVQKQLQAFQNDIADGLQINKDYTLQEWLAIFMELHRRNIKPVTYESYRYTIRTINEHLGSMRISAIKPMHIERLLQTLEEEGKSTSYTAKVKAVLYMSLDKAENNDLVRRNAARYVEKRRHNAAKEKECFSEEEVRILLHDLPLDRIGHSIRVLLCSGLRTQELLGLEPRHIASNGSHLVVEQAVTMVRGTATVSTPKSNAGYRTVPLPQNVWSSALYLKENANGDYIWSARGNAHQPANPSTFRAAYRQAIESIPEVPYKSPHTTRHTYVSLLQAKHIDMSTIQSLVGHSSVAMTNHYLHVHESIRKEAVAVFDSAFEDNTNNIL